MLIQEEWEDQPNLMKDHYLQASEDLRTMVIIRSANDTLLTAMVMKEVALCHIVEIFRTQRRVGMHERMAPPQEEAGEFTNTAYAGNGDVARQHDPKYWRRKTQAEDLKNAKAFLQKDLLSTEGIEQFDT